MNYSTAVFLINKNMRAVQAVYEPGNPDGWQPPGPVVKRTTFKTLDPSIKIGDFVIVPTNTRHGMTVCKIVEVDSDIDFDSAVSVDWIIGKIDRAPFERTLADEGVAIQAMKSAELRKRRDDLRTALFADQMEALKALPMTALNGEVPK